MVFKSDLDRFDRIKVGQTKSVVVQTLGKPDYEYNSKDAPEDYYVKGYSSKKRPVTGGVMIYVGEESILYVYFDEKGVVEETIVGGS
jgi:outer membrane protein assembly factor BamE (lipoprotein component of BamABCDE complex)